MGTSVNRPPVQEGAGAPAVEVIVLDRPDRRNALSTQLCAEISERMAIEPPSGRRCYLIYGTGTTFSAGADLGEVGELAAALSAGNELEINYADEMSMMDRIAEQPLPVVAWLNGPAIGAGAVLALAADIRLVASTAYLNIPAAKLGLGFDSAYVERVVRGAGRQVAVELLVAASNVDAETMLQLRVALGGAETVEEAMAYAERIARLAPISLAGHRRGLQGAAEESDRLAEVAIKSADVREGISAFFERRPPKFAGS